MANASASWFQAPDYANMSSDELRNKIKQLREQSDAYAASGRGKFSSANYGLNTEGNQYNAEANRLTDFLNTATQREGKASQDAEKKALQDKFNAATVGRGEAILNDPNLAATYGRMTGYEGDLGNLRTQANTQNTGAIGQNQSILDEYRGKALTKPMYRGDTILNDPTSKAALDRLLAISGGEGMDGAGGVMSQYTDQTASAAESQANRLRDQAAQTGMSMADPAFQARLTGIDTQRQQANNAARASVAAANQPVQASAALNAAQLRLAQTMGAQTADMNYANNVNGAEAARAAQLANMGGNIFNQGLQAQSMQSGLVGQQTNAANQQALLRLQQQGLANGPYAQAAQAYANATFSAPAGSAGYGGAPQVQAYRPQQQQAQPQQQANAPQQQAATPSTPAYDNSQDKRWANDMADSMSTNDWDLLDSSSKTKPQAQDDNGWSTYWDQQDQQDNTPVATPHDADTMNAWVNNAKKAAYNSVKKNPINPASF